ncbi:MAG: sodium:proton antiporter [Planctomycetota bacterium]|nr:sodium:proton antiporter [Planctomycetota bacterium]
MKKVALFSILLILGLIGSQFLPALPGGAGPVVAPWLRLATMIALAFIMIHVGYEFEIDRSNLRQYGWDYVVAFTAASFPWLFVTLYFVFVMLPSDQWGQWPAWKETLLAGRFAAPTSAGVLFSMLAAAGLSATWLFRKTRILAIFDDLDTVLLMIPLKMLMVGLAWQLGVIVFLMAGLLVIAFVLLHRVRIPVTWPWVIGYAVLIGLTSEVIYAGSKAIDPSVPVHIEVLLPAFVLGCIMARPEGADPHADDAREGHQEGPESPVEQRVSTIVSAVFMVLVGLSMPAVFGLAEPAADSAAQAFATTEMAGDAAAESEMITAAQPSPSWGVIALHVLAITVISNLGKMFPALCYRREAPWRHRLAVAIGMWPRGEVGAGVLVISLSYGIGGPVVTVAMLSLALNLLLTGVFILAVKRLLGLTAQSAGAD